jgi:glycosyltransferase involved in cell wall biosynthesis
MSSARVLVVTSATHGHRTWGEALVRAFDRAELAVDHLSFSRSRVNRVLGYSVPFARGWDLPAVRRLALTEAQLHRFAGRVMAEYDAVHVMASGLAHPFAAARGRAGLSVGLDCTAQLRRDEMGSNPLQERLRAIAEGVTFRRADHIVSMSRWAAASVEREYRTRAVEVVPPSSYMVWADRPPRRPGPLRVVFVGTGWHRKGGDRLLSAWRRTAPRGAELRLVGGDIPPSAAEVPGVAVLGRLPREVVVEQVLPDADVFAFPTRHDQSSWVLAEAAGAGLPVISTAVGGISELVIDGVTGVLVDGDGASLDDALHTLLSDAVTRERMGTASLDRARTMLDETANFDRLAASVLALAERRGRR